MANFTCHQHTILETTKSSMYMNAIGLQDGKLYIGVRFGAKAIAEWILPWLNILYYGTFDVNYHGRIYYIHNRIFREVCTL